MKLKTILSIKILIPLIALSISSCQKDEHFKIEQLSSLTMEVLSKTTLEELKQGQALLSPSEREILWRNKLSFILSNNREKLTKDQRSIIFQIRDFLLRNGMQKLINQPEIGSIFLRENLPYFSKHFNKAQLNILIESPYFNKDMTVYTIDDGLMMTQLAELEGPTKNCTCKYDLGCPGMGNYCELKSCYIDNQQEMCGLFGTESCRYRCTGWQPDI